MGIEIVAIASDGDQRLLTSMKHNAQLKSLFEPVEIAYIQDTIHLGGKLRNRMNKPSIILPMGNKQVSVTHLKLLIRNVPKDVHGLVSKDICPDDKMNYRSLEKVMEPRVLSALSVNVIDSEATAMYIKLMGNITSSFRNLTIDPIERVIRIWHALYFIRIWRNWIKKTNYSMVDNFITTNAYACLELNAHGIIHILRRLRNESDDSLFLPVLFDSQPCEQTFRQLRTMTTLNWTKVNFSMLELTHMVSRIDLQNEIAYNKLKDTGISFPRIENKISTFSLPADYEIENALLFAKKQAIDDARKFGMQCSEDEIKICDLPSVELNNVGVFRDDENVPEEMLDQDAYDFEDTEEDSEMLNDLLIRNLCLKDYPEKSAHLDGNSRFAQITDDDGFTKTVQKSSVVWLLSGSKNKLSSDRTIRVQNRSNRQVVRRSTSAPDLSARLSEERMFSICDEILIGQWCMFKKDSKKSNQLKTDTFLFGAITSFQYKTGKTQKQKQYRWESAAIKTPNIQALASWYRISKEGKFIPIEKANSFYVDIQNYFATIVEPDFCDSSIFISNDRLTHINGCLAKLNDGKHK